MSVQTHKSSTVCGICQREIHRPLLVSNGLVFCQEHTREFKRRRHEGVSTAELNPLWGDTLANWRERPPELDKETQSGFLTSSFFLWKRDEYWLIFSRSYPQLALSQRSKPGQTFSLLGRGKRTSPSLSRLPDHIAVNTQTGEIRRFVDVSENEVLDDLRGIHPAPAQAELAEFWGQRKPSGIRERTREHFRQQFLDERGHIRIPELVRLLHFPLYGPVGNPLDLTLNCSISMSFAYIDALSSVGFVYSQPAQTGIIIELVASEVNERSYTLAQVSNGLALDSARAFFQSKNQSRGEQETSENLSSWQGTLTIAGNLFTGEMYHQPQPDKLSWFYLSSEQTSLAGNASGLSEDELLQWLKALQIINQQDDILLSYQHEYDEDAQRVSGK